MAAQKRATSKDVAKLAGVSQSTVSMILNNTKGAVFAEETVCRVLDACATLQYKGREPRRYTASDTKTILVVCPSMNNLYYVNLIQAVQEQAQEMGYRALMMSTFRDEQIENGLLGLVGDLSIAGVIFLYSPNTSLMLQKLGRRVPVVLIYDKNPSLDADIVELNSIKLGMIIGEHLTNLGHRRIAYITTPLDKSQIARRRRLEGLEIKFAEKDISADNIIVCTPESEGVDLPRGMSEHELGYRITQKVIGRYDITAMVGTNDMVALGIMDALLEQKLRIPQDYSVCGCDNTLPSRLKSVSLTSVEHFSARKGKEAAEILARKIERGSLAAAEDSPVSIVRVEYAPRLIARASTGVNKRR